MARKLVAEALGSFFLLATVVGSGIMAERLAGGNIAIALLGNTIPTGAILFVLITLLGPVSGAHFNPAVTLAFVLRREIRPYLALAYVLIQIIGALAGVMAAHVMFDLPLLEASGTARSGPGQWAAEVIATFGLVTTILGCLRYAPSRIPAAVGLYITAAYWFTSSTSFANPAVTLARSLTDTFAGITPAHGPMFIFCQLAGAIAATGTAAWLFGTSGKAHG